MSSKYRIEKNRATYLNYHFLFCPRYRRKIFVDEEVKKRFYEIMKENGDELNLEILDLECGDDYCRVKVNALSDISPYDIVVKFKTISSKKLRAEFKHLNHLDSLWTRAFLVTIDEKISDETLEKYLEIQKKRG